MKNALGKIITIIAAAILVGTLIQMKYATAAEIGRDGRFTAYNDGTVLDTKTNLMWAAKDNGSGIDWGNAKSYCENYHGGGYTDWRLPTSFELAGLYDYDKYYKSDCGYYVYLTPLIRLTCPWAWTSETRISEEKRLFRGKIQVPEAAYIYFHNGQQFWSPQDYNIFTRVLPVRTAKIAKPGPLKKTDADVKNNNSDPSSEYSQKLRELKKLKDEGLLTDSEYEQKRKAIVDSM